MSIEIVQKLFNLVEQNDLDTYLTYFAEGAEYKAGNYPPVFGPQAIGEFAKQVAPYFDKIEHKVKKSWQNGDTVIAEMDLVYHRKDGKVATVPCCDVVVFENGKVKSYHAYLDAAPAFA